MDEYVIVQKYCKNCKHIAKCFIPLNVADVLSCGFYKRKEEKNNAQHRIITDIARNHSGCLYDLHVCLGNRH